jgi:hopene-associated glycosyltransferase HpnB
MTFWLLLGIISALAWVYLTFGHGRFWQVSLDAALPLRGVQWPKIAVVIPARNESDSIGQTISSLLAQDYAGDWSVTLVDDSSTDDTAAVAAAVAKGDPRLTIITAPPLQAGWSGKLSALNAGLATIPADVPYILFTDADIGHPPSSLTALVSRAEKGGYDLTSLMVMLHCRNFAEKLLIPAFIYFFRMLYPFAWINDPDAATAGAAGGVILLRREALARIGGLEALKGALIDDCTLAAHVKEDGPIWLGLSKDTVSLRPHDGFADIGGMIARTAYTQLAYSPVFLLLCVLGMGLVFLVPLALLLCGSVLGIGLGAVALGLMVASFVPMIRLYSLSPLWALTLPMAAAFYLGATIYSAVLYHRGKGGQWKGRIQAGS